mgnify:CR=1 FL=1
MMTPYEHVDDDVLERMGCRVERSEDATTLWGPAGGAVRGVDVDLNAMPDVAPTLAVLAAFADGPTCIRNVAGLRVKETDRLAALATELARMNVQTHVHDDGIEVLPGRPCLAAAIETYDDHRMAMSFALAGLRLDGMVIHNPACVAKTFPEFFGHWAKLGEWYGKYIREEAQELRRPGERKKVARQVTSGNPTGILSAIECSCAQGRSSVGLRISMPRGTPLSACHLLRLL